MRGATNPRANTGGWLRRAHLTDCTRSASPTDSSDATDAPIAYPAVAVAARTAHRTTSAKATALGAEPMAEPTMGVWRIVWRGAARGLGAGSATDERHKPWKPGAVSVMVGFGGRVRPGPGNPSPTLCMGKAMGKVF